MFEAFRPDDRVPMYFFDQLAEFITELIESGQLPQGARLPNESALAKQAGMSEHTVRRAMKVLSERGLIKTLPAKGSYITGGVRDE